MASVPDGHRRSSPQSEAGRFLALLGATGVAICQPVLDTVGKSPETVVFRRADGSDLLVLALLIALVPPIALWAVGYVLGRRAPRARRAIHGATMGALAGLAVVQVVGSWSRPLAVATALVAGVGAWILVVRVAHARLWFQLLAVLPLASVLVFLTTSRASDAVGGDGLAAVDRAPGGSPIVLIVLDELPTASLLDERGLIDPVRFPNLARLADGATWHRNHTATSGWTATAVPAIFSGQTPENDTSVFTERPDNIFRLLEGSHDLVVSEAVTRLCPVEQCGETPISPTGGDPPSVSGDLQGLLGDAIDVWRWRVTGSAAGDPLAGFEEELTAASPPSTAAPPASGTDDPPPADLDFVRQPVRVDAFLDAIEPGDRPIAAIVHFVLPHQPWRFLPDGTVYRAGAQAGAEEEAYPDAWVADVRRQQHLLQAAYADRLVGQILDKVRDAGFYDEAVIAVTADHGIAFPVDDLGRRHSAENEVGIMWVPLVVKAPHQTRGTIDDSNLQSTDVFPTIASLAGIEIPWELDGAAAGSPAIADRGDRKQYHRHESILEPGPTVVLDVDGAAGLRELLGSSFAPVGADEDPVRGLYRLAPGGELIGRPLTTARQAPQGALTVDDRDRVASGGEPAVVISGAVDGQPGAAQVVAAVDGTVVAISPLYEDDGRRRFLLLLPVGPPVDPARVRLGLVSEAGELIEAGPLMG